MQRFRPPKSPKPDHYSPKSNKIPSAGFCSVPQNNQLGTVLLHLIRLVVAPVILEHAEVELIPPHCDMSSSEEGIVLSES